MQPLDTAGLVRKAVAQRLRLRGFCYLLSRQCEDMRRIRERAWALCELARIDACDRRENLAIARYTAHRLRLIGHLGSSEPKAGGGVR